GERLAKTYFPNRNQKLLLSSLLLPTSLKPFLLSLLPMKRFPLSFTKKDAADRWMNIHLMASSMNQNLELEASLGKKPIDLVFLKSTSGLEIIDPFCDPRDSDKIPISYPPSVVLIEFQ
ncbi:hypothetical protein HAX54_028550, partial [Datura stramonium]|nr:hypothetical protein [Datura stramonium]